MMNVPLPDRGGLLFPLLSTQAQMYSNFTGS